MGIGGNYTRNRMTHLSRLSNVEQVVEQRLVLVLAKQVKLLQHKHHRLRLLLGATTQSAQQKRQVLCAETGNVNSRTESSAILYKRPRTVKSYICCKVCISHW